MSRLSRASYEIQNTILIMVGLLLIPIYPAPVLAGQNDGFSQYEIFDWVSKELEIEGQYPIPEIRLVSKKILQVVLLNESGKGFERLIGLYGGTDPERRRRHYLSNILGLFLPETGVAYVRKDLTPCRRNSIIAHEYTHYFQNRQFGRTSYLKPHEQEEVHIFREQEAREIENQFFQQFCNTK